MGGGTLAQRWNSDETRQRREALRARWREATAAELADPGPDTAAVLAAIDWPYELCGAHLKWVREDTPGPPLRELPEVTRYLLRQLWLNWEAINREPPPEEGV
jgi:hypothetical protein